MLVFELSNFVKKLQLLDLVPPILECIYRRGYNKKLDRAIWVRWDKFKWYRVVFRNSYENSELDQGLVNLNLVLKSVVFSENGLVDSFERWCRNYYIERMTPLSLWNLSFKASYLSLWWSKGVNSDLR